MNKPADISLTSDDLMNFTEALRDGFEAGTPFNLILKEYAATVPNKKLSDIIKYLAVQTEMGKYLSEGMLEFPKAFSSYYRSMIRAAEQSSRWTRNKETGRDGILDQLTKYIKRTADLQEKITAALIYPAFITVAMIGALSVFGFYVLPTLKEFFDSIGAKSKSIFTTATFAFAAFAQKYWWLPPAGAVFAGFGSLSWWNSGGKELWEKHQFHMPYLGKMLAMGAQADTAWMMGMLYEAGITPQEILQIVAESARNRELGKAIEKARDSFLKGEPFGQAIKNCSPIFAGQFYHVVSTAQKSGKLAEALQNYGELMFVRFDREAEKALKMIPLIMLFIMAFFVAIVVIGFYGAIGEVIQSIR